MLAGANHLRNQLKKKERKKKIVAMSDGTKTILIRISVEHITHHQSLEKSTENKKHDQKYCIFDGTCAHHVNFSKKPKYSLRPTT